MNLPKSVQTLCVRVTPSDWLIVSGGSIPALPKNFTSLGHVLQAGFEVTAMTNYTLNNHNSVVVALKRMATTDDE